MEQREPRRGNLPPPLFFASVDSGGVRGGVEEERLGDEREYRHNFMTTVIYLYC
jgi:hypothetical protein